MSASASSTPAAPAPDAAADEEVTVHVLLFSVLKEAVGEAALSLTLPEGATGDLLLDRLAEEYADVARYRPMIRLAVNEEYAPGQVALREGDAVALITPVSGG